jgi:hypothetical protein
MVREYIEGQCIYYYVLMALEAGKTQAIHIQSYLRDFNEELTLKQISSSLQRLKREGLAIYENSVWKRVYKVSP